VPNRRLVEPPDHVTPPQYARRLGVDAAKVLGWIARGELRAFNAAALPSGRPRWLIPLEAIAEFERGRAAKPARRARAPRRRLRKPTGEYF
jgi:hypothetical protein